MVEVLTQVRQATILIILRLQVAPSIRVVLQTPSQEISISTITTAICQVIRAELELTHQTRLIKLKIKDHQTVEEPHLQEKISNHGAETT